jgi:2-polyprenyl-3-methyl-5-hydroxy-6-metoxy-1,4-benzoquinol methylase
MRRPRAKIDSADQAVAGVLHVAGTPGQSWFLVKYRPRKGSHLTYPRCPLAGRLAAQFFIRSRHQAHDYDRRVTASRCDDHAAWYIDYTSRWELSSTASLPSDLNDQRVLDLGCGWGQLSRELAGRGAAVTAVDLSGKLLERARDIERRHPVGIRYVHGDAMCMDWWDGTAFDGVVCNMALMDIDDLGAALRTVASVAAPYMSR